jgi:DUF971 family protein
MATNRLLPINLQIVGDELAIAWNDGVETFLRLEVLRRACPCASCCGEPDVLGQVFVPESTPLRPESFQLASWAYVGGYAWQPFWADGHSTGLFSYAYLRKLVPVPPPS